MGQFGLLENSEIESLLATYGTKASEKEITRRLGEGAKGQSMESLLAALVGTPQAQQAQGQPQSQKQAQPQQQSEAGKGLGGSFWQKLGTGLMMAGAAGQGQDPSAVLRNLMEAQQAPMEAEERGTLIAQRRANTRLMEKQYQELTEESKPTEIYRDPITGEEIDPETAKKNMEEGLGIYQVNQRLSTRAGVIEKPLNKVPNLTQEEKKYVNDSRMIGNTLITLESGFDNLYDKYGKANWQAFQMERMPYIFAQDQDVQNLKSELIYLKAAIPFMRGGKQLTKEEGKRIDIMLNPFGKAKETYKKDIHRFEEEFLLGADIMKFGVNAGLMRKLIKTDKKQKQTQEQPNKDIDILKRLNLDPNKYELVR